MDLVRDMRVFVQVAEQGSFRQVAKFAGISNSCVTRCIANLETRLSVRLIERSTRSVALTEAGARYLENCRTWLEHFDEVEDAFFRRNEAVLAVTAQLTDRSLTDVRPS